MILHVSRDRNRAGLELGLGLELLGSGGSTKFTGVVGNLIEGSGKAEVAFM